MKASNRAKAYHRVRKREPQENCKLYGMAWHGMAWPGNYRQMRKIPRSSFYSLFLCDTYMQNVDREENSVQTTHYKLFDCYSNSVKFKLNWLSLSLFRSLSLFLSLALTLALPFLSIWMEGERRHSKFSPTIYSVQTTDYKLQTESTKHPSALLSLSLSLSILCTP